MKANSLIFYWRILLFTRAIIKKLNMTVKASLVTTASNYYNVDSNDSLTEFVIKNINHTKKPIY